ELRTSLRRVVRFEAGVFVRAVAERPVARLAAAAKVQRIEGALDLFLAVDILQLGAAGDFVWPVFECFDRYCHILPPAADGSCEWTGIYPAKALRRKGKMFG
ncbi:MAG: hypothetical protein ACXW6K_07725, partial [Candidatus Binatia bacterium]